MRLCLQIEAVPRFRAQGCADYRRFYRNDRRPVGQIETPPPLTIEETRINGQSYLEQASMILSRTVDRPLQLRMAREDVIHDVIEMAANNIRLHNFSSGTILRSDSRQACRLVFMNCSIRLHGMDSVAIDWMWNWAVQTRNSTARWAELQKAYGKEAQCILTMPILEGTDGVEKMSKSLTIT